MQTGTKTTDKSGEKRKEPAPYRPAWYKKNLHGSADTVGFYGQAMAAATDSTAGMLKAEENAQRHLEQVIGDTLEQLRRRVATQKKNGPFSDASFLIHLRNAVDGLGAKAKITNSVSVKKNGRWIGFAKVRIRRSRLKQLIRQQLSEYPEFIESW